MELNTNKKLLTVLITSALFGNAQAAITAKGHVYEDKNGNGNKELGEPGIGGFGFFLHSTANNVSASYRTNSNGDYSAQTLAGLFTLRLTGGMQNVRVTQQTTVFNNALDGSTVTLNNFGIQSLGSITGSVKDDAGTGIINVVLELLDVAGSPIRDTSGNLITAKTGADGNYKFADVPAGDYQVKEQQPAGYYEGPDSIDKDANDTVDNTNVKDNKVPVTVSLNEIDDKNSFVEFRPAEIKGFVKDDTGAGIEGVTLQLLDGNGTLLVGLTATTNANGSYRFAVDARDTGGQFQVQESQPATHTNVSDSIDKDANDIKDNSDTTDDVVPVTIQPGETDEGNNFIENRKGFIKGSVKDDTSAGIEGVVLELLDDAGNPVLDRFSNQITVTTIAGGNYTFSDIPTGDYKVKEQQPTGYDNGSDSADTTGDQPNTDTTDDIIPVTVEPGETDDKNNFVEKRQASLISSITGSVKDDTGTGIVGVVLELLDDAGKTVQDASGNPITVVTDVDGNYKFTDVPVGDYQVKERQPAGYAGNGSDSIHKDANDIKDNSDTTDNAVPVTVVKGETDSENNFVENRPASITGSVKDNSGTGIVGVVLELLDDAGKTVQDASGNPITVVTGVDGNYTFADVPAGDYKVKEQQPTGYDNVSDSSDSTGDQPNTDTTDDIIPVTVKPGETDSANNFVEKSKQGTVKGHVYEDTDGSGTQDSGEPDLNGVVVTIKDKNGNEQTLVTDASGNYSAIVPEGDTTVDIEAPAGTTQTQGTNPTPVKALAGKEVDEENNGYKPTPKTGTVKGHIYEDTNGSGTQDSGEPDLKDIVVTIKDKDGNEQTVVTDASGNFTAIVPEGDATVDIKEPVSHTQTEGTDPTNIKVEAGKILPVMNNGFKHLVTPNLGNTAKVPGLGGLGLFLSSLLLGLFGRKMLLKKSK